MIRLFRVVSLLMFILVAGLMAIIGLTYRNTNRFAYLFTNPDGTRCESPCLFGADPFAMSVEQMDKMLSLSPIVKHSSKVDALVEVRFIHEYEQVQVTLSQRTGAQAEFNLASDFPTWSELLVLMGKPERIALNTYMPVDKVYCVSILLLIQGRLVILFPQVETDVCMSPSQKIARIILSPTIPDYMKRYAVWQGFMPDAAYIEVLTQLARNP